MRILGLVQGGTNQLLILKHHFTVDVYIPADLQGRSSQAANIHPNYFQHLSAASLIIILGLFLHDFKELGMPLLLLDLFQVPLYR